MNRLVILGLFGLLAASPAAAQTVTGGYGGYQRIARGVFELGLDNLLLVRQGTQKLGSGDDDVSTLEIAYTGGLTPRYFIADNFALGLSVGFFVRKQTATTKVGSTETETILADDSGVIGFLMANYYIRLGNSFFFKPGIGAGGFTGTRSLPVAGTTDQKVESALAGAAVRADLGFAFFASQHMNLRAGLDFVYRSGSDTPDGADEGQDFSTIDGGFNIGIGYLF
ncbi:MAG: hypothetical protein KC549_11860 [Myxococcales bacterium]|nr:hypothetical protein [Myxococcales bacterium]